MTGKGSLNHNSRKFHAKNTDPNRTHWNVEYCNEDIKDVYHELFDEALKRYNDKQTRKDRKIDDYYEKIRSGKQEKLFHEVIIQIGDKDNMGSEMMEGQLAAKILDEYMKGCPMDFVSAMRFQDEMYEWWMSLSEEEREQELRELRGDYDIVSDSIIIDTEWSNPAMDPDAELPFS